MPLKVTNSTLFSGSLCGLFQILQHRQSLCTLHKLLRSSLDRNACTHGLTSNLPRLTHAGNDGAITSKTRVNQSLIARPNTTQGNAGRSLNQAIERTTVTEECLSTRKDGVIEVTGSNSKGNSTSSSTEADRLRRVTTGQHHGSGKRPHLFKTIGITTTIGILCFLCKLTQASKGNHGILVAFFLCHILKCFPCRNIINKA